MGVTLSKNCECFVAVTRVASTLWQSPNGESNFLISDENDEIKPAGLLSEQEIQSLLSESQERNNNNYEPV